MKCCNAKNILYIVLVSPWPTVWVKPWPILATKLHSTRSNCWKSIVAETVWSSKKNWDTRLGAAAHGELPGEYRALVCPNTARDDYALPPVSNHAPRPSTTVAVRRNDTQSSHYVCVWMLRVKILKVRGKLIFVEKQTRTYHSWQTSALLQLNNFNFELNKFAVKL